MFRRYPTSADCYHGVIREALENPETNHGYRSSRTWANDVVLEIQDPQANIEFSRVGFTPSRWKHFLSHYVDPYDFSVFFQKAIRGTRGQEIMYLAPQHAPHSLGNCFIGLSMTLNPTPRLRILSRTVTWAPTGLLDLSFSSLVSAALTQALQLESPMRLRWEIGTLQHNSMGMLPSIIGLEDLVAQRKTRTAVQVAQRLAEYPKYHQSNYKSARRVAQKMDQLTTGNWHHEPFYPTVPPWYFDGCLRPGPNKLTLEEVQQRFLEVDPHRIKLVFQQLGLLFKGLSQQYDIRTPRVRQALRVIRQLASSHLVEIVDPLDS